MNHRQRGDEKWFSLTLGNGGISMIEAIETALNTGTKDPKVEEWILRGKNCRSSDSCPPGHAFRYALEVLGDRWPEAEEIILSDSVVAVRYAKEAMKTRWPLLEKQLLKGRRIPLICDRRSVAGSGDKNTEKEGCRMDGLVRQRSARGPMAAGGVGDQPERSC